MSTICEKPLCKSPKAANRSQVNTRMAYYICIWHFVVTLGQITVVIGYINAKLFPIIRLLSWNKSHTSHMVKGNSQQIKTRDAESHSSRGDF